MANVGNYTKTDPEYFLITEYGYQLGDDGGVFDPTTGVVFGETALDAALSTTPATTVEDLQDAVEEPYAPELYQKGSYYYYKDEFGNEIDTGTRDIGKASSAVNSSANVVNNNLTPLTNSEKYTELAKTDM